MYSSNISCIYNTNQHKANKSSLKMKVTQNKTSFLWEEACFIYTVYHSHCLHYHPHHSEQSNQYKCA